MSKKLATIGLSQNAHAVRGDLGAVIIRSEAGPEEACGIFTGTRWAVRGARGLWIGPAEATAIWRV